MGHIPTLNETEASLALFVFWDHPEWRRSQNKYNLRAIRVDFLWNVSFNLDLKDLSLFLLYHFIDTAMFHLYLFAET